MSKRLGLCWWLVALLLIGGSCGYAEPVGPGWYSAATNKTAPQRLLSASVNQAAVSNLTLLPAAAATSPEIQELARALNHDPKRIYEYVYNNIDYEPYYGLLKGPVRTLLDRGGNDWDQASLLIELLKASGYGSASYVYGTMTIPNADLANWLHLGNAPLALNIFGIPQATTATQTTLFRAWVEVDLGAGGLVVLDPAYKRYTAIPGINWAGLLGYNQASLRSMAASGAEVNNDYVRKINSAGITTELTRLTANLVTGLRNIYPNADVAEIIGGWQIIPVTLDSKYPDLPYPACIQGKSSSIPAAFLHTVRIKLGDIDKTYATADIAAKKIAITFTNALPMMTAVCDSKPAAGAVCLQPMMTNSPEIDLQTSQPKGVYDFGRVPALAGWLANSSFYYQNTDIDDLIYQADLQNNSSGDFAVVQGANPTRVAAGQKFNAVVKFAAMADASPGYKTATLRIVVRSITGGPTKYYTYDLRGVIAQPPKVSGSGFSVQIAGGQSYTGACRIVNNGSLSLAIDKIWLSGDSSFAALDLPPTPYHQSPGAKDFLIRYSGNAADTQTAKLNICFSYDGVRYYSDNSPSMTIEVCGQTYLLPRACLRLDDEIIAIEGGFPSAESVATLDLNIGHPDGYGDQAVSYSLKRYGSYVVIHSFGESRASGFVEKQERRLEKSGELTDALAVMGQHWMQETALAANLISRIAGGRAVPQHRFGIMAQEEGFYVDVKADFRVDYDNGSRTMEDTALLASAMEHGVLEQYQNNQHGVSTVKLIDLANSQGERIYCLDAGNYDAVASKLSSYSASDFQEFQNCVSGKGKVLVPAGGALQLEHWTGKGYIAYRNSGEMISVGMIIGGGYSNATATVNLYGGYGTKPGPVNVAYVDNCNQNVYQQVYHPVSQEPVDLATGAYTVDQTDLEIGNNSVALGLHRSYNSQMHKREGSLGYGWSHSYDVRISEASDYKLGLGERTPVDMAPLLVASYVSLQLLNSEDTALSWTTAALVNKWAMDQLIHNAATVYNGGQIMNYSRLPDGSYNPPPGSTVQLKKDGKYQLEERLGKVWLFNGQGLLESVQDSDGNTISLSYDGRTNLQKVASSFGRTLNLGYNGDLLVSLADNAGRVVRYGYDGDNNLVSYTDPANNTWRYRYDDEHRITGLFDPLGQLTVSNGYNTLGQVVSQISAVGGLWKFSYSGFATTEEDPAGGRKVYCFDKNGRQIGLQDALGNKSTAEYDGQGHLFRQTDALGNTTVYQYDGRHNCTNVVDALGQVTAMQYDSESRLVAKIRSLGQTTCYKYDSKHHVVAITDALSNTVQQAWNGKGLLAAVTDQNGAVTRYDYDGGGNVVAITRPAGGGVIRQAWNTAGDMVQSTDPNGHSMSYTYDQRRLLTAEKDPLGREKRYRYNAAGLKTEFIDAAGNSWKYSYTPSYKLSSEDMPSVDGYGNRSTKRLVYDKRDYLVRTIDPLGQSTKYEYDGAGRQTAVTDPLGHTMQFAYDANGNVITSQDALGNVTSNGYDALNRLVVTRNALGYAKVNSYDSLGRLTNTVDESGRSTVFGYDLLNRQTMVTYPDGGSVRLAYDAVGNLTNHVNALGNSWSFRYDALHRLVAEVDPLGKTRSYGYDGVGNRTTRQDADGRTTHYEYDAANQLTKTIYPDGKQGTRSYDANGNVVRAVNNAANISCAYNAWNQLVTVSDSQRGFVVNYGYDMAGRQTWLVYGAPGGSLQADYDYNAAGMLTKVGWLPPGGKKKLELVSYLYDVANRCQGASYGNGIAGYYVYDAVGRMDSYRYSSNGVALTEHSFCRDGLGFKTQEVVKAGLEVVLAPERLANVYNAADQLVKVAASNHPNRQVGWDLNYSADGELCRQSSSTGVVDYAWDYDGRLLSYKCGNIVISNIYDALGVRIGRTVNGCSFWFCSDRTAGNNPLLMELDNAGHCLRSYVWGQQGLVAQIESNKLVRYVHADDLGNVVALSDKKGRLTDEVAYDPYGKIGCRLGWNYTPYLWGGSLGVYREVDQLYLMGARYYDARLKRFLSKDPVGFGGGLNLYAYAAGNPVFFTDPLGLCAEQSSGRGFFGAATDAIKNWWVNDVPADWSGWGKELNRGLEAFAAMPVAVVGRIGKIGECVAKTSKAIDIDQALIKANNFMECGLPLKVLESHSGLQFIQTYSDELGRTITRRAGFDLNPTVPHVQKYGPHLNLQIQIDGIIQHGDPHIPILPNSIRSGDF